MIELYIPKTRFLMNNQYDLVDNQGYLVYRHRTNFLQTKRLLVNAENEEIMSSKTVFSFVEKHMISQHNEFLAEVSFKSIWSRTIALQEGYSVRVSGYMRFKILKNQEEILSITKSKQNEFAFTVNVIDDQIDFLIMLMFTIIVMLNNS